MDIERGPVTGIEIVKQRLPATGSTPESFTVPWRALCLGMIVFSRTDLVSSGLLSCCRFAGVKNVEWMIRVTTRVISATVILFRAHIWRQNLLPLVILYRENIIPPAQNLNIQRHRLHCQSNTLNVTPSRPERIICHGVRKSGEKSMSIFDLRSIPATHPEYSPHAFKAANDRGGNKNHRKRSRRRGGSGFSWEFLVVLGSPKPDPISDQKLSVSTPDFRPGIGRNYVIIT